MKKKLSRESGLPAKTTSIASANAAGGNCASHENLHEHISSPPSFEAIEHQPT